jgi:hypothetical protein
MYPALEITLRLDDVCAAQPSSHAARGYAFRSIHLGTNLLPRPCRIDRSQVPKETGQDVGV